MESYFLFSLEDQVALVADTSVASDTSNWTVQYSHAPVYILFGY